jgi:hypothetical protein
MIMQKAERKQGFESRVRLQDKRKESESIRGKRAIVYEEREREHTRVLCELSFLKYLF